ncbi:hypothetical protein SAMN05661096_03332 [Marivirga sericea]|uniref:Uncharacterized protein n=1 Tax=Marivirga sericea TaxID=1028 RepID=A0A1X7KZD3_9BACT|nr:hypothetical protein SAMN05661096_03332 [Marivirga sericea]
MKAWKITATPDKRFKTMIPAVKEGSTISESSWHYLTLSLTEYQGILTLT